ncbi:MAG: lipase [Burkholderiaceae bacterium]|nr:lipase [Burkholderiaceae bacterium]
MSTDIRICFLGDSLVNGTEDDSVLGWPGRVCADTRARGIPITHYNLGIRRETTSELLLRWREECHRRLPPICDGRIVISSGVNDTSLEGGTPRVKPEQSIDNFQHLLSETKAFQILVVGPPPVGDNEQNTRIDTLSKQIAIATKAHDVPFIDLFSTLSADRRYLEMVRENDGAHPRADGYDRIARLVSSSPCWWFREP